MIAAVQALAAALTLAAAPAVVVPPAGCVNVLTDVRSGTGDRAYASHYVTADSFGYGEFVTGAFGGQSLWRKRDNLWCRIATGTRVLDKNGIVASGVPAAVADTLLREMRATPELAPPKTPAHHR